MESLGFKVAQTSSVQIFSESDQLEFDSVSQNPKPVQGWIFAKRDQSSVWSLQVVGIVGIETSDIRFLNAVKIS